MRSSPSLPGLLPTGRLREAAHPTQLARSGVDVLGVPMDLGATRFGASTAPTALRAAGLSTRLSRFTSTRDLGDITVPARHVAVPGEENARYLGEIALACQRVYDRVTDSANARRRTLVLGGDHAIAAGSVAAASEAALRRGGRLGVLWIDAHGDCNTEWTTPSGNVHGMPVASLLGFGPEALRFGRPLSAHQLVMLGVREMDPGEARILDHLAIDRVPADEVAAVHADRMAAHLLAILDLHGCCDTLHVSLDMDGLDPLDAPGVGTPVPNGLRLLPTLALLRALAARRPIISADLVELDPSLDPSGRTVNAALSLVEALFGP